MRSSQSITKNSKISEQSISEIVFPNVQWSWSLTVSMELSALIKD